MVDDKAFSVEGHCTCGAVRYLMKSKPMFVHCCHCRWCQRETGASFALNALIEADRVVLLKGEPEVVNTPSNSGKGQKIARCPICHIALWSNYAGAGEFGDMLPSSTPPGEKSHSLGGVCAFLVFPYPLVEKDALLALSPSTPERRDFLFVRAGLHHGPALLRHTRHFGSTVNLAARV